VSLVLQGEFRRIKKTSQLDRVAVEDGSDQLYFSTSGVGRPGSVRFLGLSYQPGASGAEPVRGGLWLICG
jgi:hypothetical protein